jgi:hypothetical protein
VSKRDYLGVREHGDRANRRRPREFAVVLWIGSVEPERARNGDLWMDTRSGETKRKPRGDG